MKNWLLSGDTFVILLLSAIGLLLLFLLKPFRKNPTSSAKATATVGTAALPDLTPEELLLKVLTRAGLSLRAIRFWTAVSRFETGDFTSPLFLKHNNFFGMKFPVKRETTATASVPPKGFARYPSRGAGAGDIVHYMREFNYPSDFDSVEDLVSLMKSKGYFEEPYDFYLAGVKSKL